jgi:Spy/CpxP family protein refolding chaperone
MRTALVTLTLALALPAMAAAQEEMHHPRQEAHGQGDMMHRGMMQHGMDMAMMHARPGPGMLLRLEDSLGLSQEQVDRLTAMREEAHTAMKEHMEAARDARTRAHEIMTGESPDLDAFRQALQEAASHTVEAQTAMARVHMEAGEVLTDDQRETLRSITGAMEELHQDGSGHPSGEGMHRGGSGGA